MKKQLFARALALFTALSLLSTTAFAHFVTIDGLDGAPMEVDTVQNGVNMIADSDSKSGSIQLTEDANENVTIAGADVTIDLNGNDLGTGSGAVITVKNDTELTLKDSTAEFDEEGNQTYSGDGSVTGGYNAVNISGNNSSVTINSGNITGGVNVGGNSDQVTVNGGTITNANSESISLSGKNDSLVINGGTVSSGSNNGAVKLYGKEANLEMTGGTIIGSNGVGVLATGSTTTRYDNYLDKADQTIEVSGGTIQGTTAIRVKSNADVTISDDADIQGRDLGIELIHSNATLNVTGGSVMSGIKTSDGSVIRDASEAENVKNITVAEGTLAAKIQPGTTVKVTPNLHPVKGHSTGSPLLTGWLETAEGDVVPTPEGYTYKVVYITINASGITPAELESLKDQLNLTYEFTVDGVTYTSSQAMWVENWVPYAQESGRLGVGVFVPKDASQTTNVTMTIGNLGIEGYDKLTECTFSQNSDFNSIGNISDNSSVTDIQLDWNTKSGVFASLGFTYHKHTAVTDPVVPATCTKTGLTEGSHCSTCNEVLKAQDKIDATGHTYTSSVTKDATCTEAGVRTYTCEDCNDSYTEEIDATGHTPGEAVRENEVPPQVGVEGSYNEVTYCTVCGDELSRATVNTPALEEPSEPSEPSEPEEPSEPTEPEQPEEPSEPSEPEEPTEPSEPDTPDVPGEDDIPDADVPMTGAPDAAEELSIEDEEVPLAGIVTLAQLLEELRQREEAAEIELPEDFKWIEHEYAQAIYWALEAGLVTDTEEEPLDPDEIVIARTLQKVLDNFVAVYKEFEDFSAEVEGEEDDIILDLGDRLTAFFAALEEYEASAK